MLQTLIGAFTCRERYHREGRGREGGCGSCGAERDGGAREGGRGREGARGEGGSREGGREQGEREGRQRTGRARRREWPTSGRVGIFCGTHVREDGVSDVR